MKTGLAGFLVVAVLLLASCGNNCPSGVNNYDPSCPYYTPTTQPYGQGGYQPSPYGQGQGYNMPGGQGYMPGGQGYMPGGQGYAPGGYPPGGYAPGGQGYVPGAYPPGYIPQPQPYYPPPRW